MVNNLKKSCGVVAPMRTFKQKSISAVLILLTLALVLSATACSDDPDEGGIIGTGVILQGTVNDAVFAQRNTVEVKSSDGLLSEVAIDANKQFATTALAGTAPWVLRVRTNNNIAVYGIAYNDGIRNINSFSDLGLRSWFAKASLDLDAQFASAKPFSTLPSALEYEDSASSVFELIEPVLVSYEVSGEELISANYSNNDQGVDRFLNRNAVLIDKDIVSFVLTDPDSQTQSVTDSTLSIKNEFRDNGSIAPTVPQDFRAIGVEQGKIVLVWVPAGDDVGVREYKIIRDGELIGVTPFPVYTDSTLLEVKQYEYKIIAIDGAKNESTTPSVFASPLLIGDNVAPPVPTLLTKRDASDSFVRFFWGQENIQDVFRFNVYRGIDDQEPSFLFSGTSSFVTDTTVQENTRYCYQVTAVDASDNESERSEILCITASNDGALNGDTSAPLVNLVVPENLDSLNCDETLTNAQVQVGNTVMPEGCYTVPETLIIGAGATLTLTEGVILKFGEAVELVVPDDATFTSIGQPENPVVLTGEFAIRGYWAGVEFRGSRSIGNVLRATVVQYAGGGDTGGAIDVSKRNSRLSIEDSLLRYNSIRALRLNQVGLTIDSFRGNLITDNDAVASVSLPILASLVGNNEYTGNVDNDLGIGSNRYTDVHITVPDLGIPIRWGGVQITKGSLSIEPGVKFNMRSAALVKVDGEFSAIGTADKPIVFKSEITEPGAWNGFLLSGRKDKTFNHVTINYAGEDRPDTGAIEVVCTPENPVKFSIDNVEIADSSSWGIYVDGAGCTTEIGQNNTYPGTALGTVRLP